MKYTRSGLVAQLKNSVLDLAQLTRAGGLPRHILGAAQRADLDGNGEVSGSREADRLFTELDRFDRDGSYHSLQRTQEIDQLLGHARPMPRVTRDEFMRALDGRALPVPELRRGLAPEVADRAAGADLNGDGAIAGSREQGALFDRLDYFDRDGSRDSLRASSGLLDLLGSGAAADTADTPSAPAAPADAASDAPSSSLPQGRTVGAARGSGYYPHNSGMEGGYVDKQGKPLRTLQDYLAGRADYVSIALDKYLYRSGEVSYGDRFRIPELEDRYGREIEFRAVDTGDAFTNRGFSRVDICTGSYRDSIDATVNGRLTLVKID